MQDPLAPLLADGVIDEVVSRLKGGKEADVWLVRSGGQVVAAKVYKARQSRSFKNDAAYREGRRVRNTRTQRAMDRGSRFGQAAAEEAWKSKESDAMFRLHAAGIRVPRPVLFHEGVLLMEVVVDAHGRPAPRLVDAPLVREQAAAIYADLRKQAVGMLASGLIHGDLSPYNVLVGHDGPVVIDLPQVVDAAHNSQSERFFLRDLDNVRRFCAALDPTLGGEGDGREIWRAYVRRELTADFVPSGRAPEPARTTRGERAVGGHRPQHAPQLAPQHPRGGSPRPHGRGGPQHGKRTQDAPANQRQPGPQRQRNAPAPEVIRVERLPHAAPGHDRSRHGTPAGDPGRPARPPEAARRPEGVTDRPGDAPIGRRRRRRRRRGR